jgi:hypothetical protein
MSKVTIDISLTLCDTYFARCADDNDHAHAKRAKITILMAFHLPLLLLYLTA